MLTLLTLPIGTYWSETGLRQRGLRRDLNKLEPETLYFVLKPNLPPSNSPWTKESGEVNSRPVYRRGNYYLAVASSNSSDLSPNWVVTSSPGSQSGFMFEKSFLAPKCPHAVYKWRYFSQNLFRTEDDDSLAVTCGASEENKKEGETVSDTEWMQLLHLLCIHGTSFLIPTKPRQAKTDMIMLKAKASVSLLTIPLDFANHFSILKPI